MRIGIKKTRRGIYSTFTSLVSVTILLAAGETLVRLFLPFNTPDTIRKYSLQYIPSIFSRHRLSPVGQIVDDERAMGRRDGNREPGHRLFVNRVGYRGPDFLPRKPQGTIRIVILGGSSVFDANARDPSSVDTHDWPHLVERFLRSHGRANVEVINAGIPGHATFDSLGRLYSQLWTYEPDYVLLYGAWNDIKYFTKLTPDTPLISLFEPFEKSNPFTEYQGFWDRFLAHSQLYIKLRNQYYGWKLHVGEEGVVPEGPLKDSYSPYASKQYRLNIELIVDACRNIKAVPILITEATLVSEQNSPEERKLIRYEYHSLTHPALVQAFDEIYRILHSVSREKRVALLDFTKELNGESEFFTDGIHLSAKGGEEVARRVGEFMMTYLGPGQTSSVIKPP